MKKVNPVIQKVREESYQQGFLNGQKLGFEHGKNTATMYFASRFDGLDQVPGIGEKTIEKIVRHFGAEYFEKVE